MFIQGIKKRNFMTKNTRRVLSNAKGHLILKANYKVPDSFKKRTKHNQDQSCSVSKETSDVTCFGPTKYNNIGTFAQICS